ncbi:CRE-REC-8 protein [Caenorhabditis remanei]|uniref:CRE-REC-8 protein n=1 Tax=Caenorhabditis remanei TaxID=31234 RepID=E3MGB8_CAERE|nr:CRE-REC-8 protein [Caenorhabditis remanei]
MVLYTEVVRSNPVFHAAWLLGTGDTKSLSKREIMAQDLSEICVQIIRMMPDKDRSTESKAALYLLSLLTYGTVLIHRTQVEFLQRDAEKLKELIRKKSFILLMAEKFDREQEIRKHTENRAKLRSTPIACLEDIDELVNLADLPMISARIGNSIYFSFFSQKSDTLHSTFVEGNGSNEQSREKRAATVFANFHENIVSKHGNEHSPNARKRPVAVETEKETEWIDESKAGQNQLEAGAVLDHIEEPQRLLPAQLDDLDLVDVPLDQQAKVTAYLQTILSLSLDETNLPPVPQDLNLFEDILSPPPKKSRLETERNGEEEFQDREVARRRQSSRPHTPINQNNLTDLHSTLKTDDQTSRIEDPAVTTEQGQTMRADKPTTPMEDPDIQVEIRGTTDTNRTGENSSPSLELDSQIQFIPPQRKRSRRNLPFVHGDDMEIDEVVQNVLQADWSSLVRKKEDVLVISNSKKSDIPLLMFNPAPNFGRSRNLPEELQEFFKSRVFRGYTGYAVSETDEESIREEPEKFAAMRLLTPNRLDEPIEFQEELYQRERFNDELMPVQIDDQTKLMQEELSVTKRLENIENDQPHEKLVESASQNLSYAFTRLLTPEKEREAAIIEELGLEPLPVTHNYAHLNLSNPNNETMRPSDPYESIRTEEDVENVRKRQKSSLGVGHQRTEDLEEDAFEVQRRLRAFDREERMRLAMEAKEDEIFFYSSGSLLPNNKQIIHDQLLR